MFPLRGILSPLGVGRGAGITYLLYDAFTTDRASGAVNGTVSESPVGSGGGVTRVVVDTNGKLTIAGGKLSFATGGVGYGNPLLRYPIVTRNAGKMMVSKMIKTTGGSVIGFSNTPSGFPDNSVVFFSSVSIYQDGGTANLGAITNDTEYIISIVLRSTGAYTFIKGGAYANWSLLWINNGYSGNVYPSLTGSNVGVFTADNIRIPDALWLPTLLVSDGFGSAGVSDGLGHAEGVAGGLGSGGAGVTWTGGAVSGGRLVITPSLGSELVGDTGFDSDAYWSKDAGITVSSSKANFSTGNGNGVYKTGLATIGNWYLTTFDIDSISAGGIYAWSYNAPKIYTSEGTGKIASGRQIATTSVGLVASGTTTATVDNFTAKPLTLSSLIGHVVNLSTPDVLADVAITLTAGTQAGQWLCLDSESSPANGLLCYHDGTNVKLDKLVNGTYTNLISVAATYGVDRVLRVITYHSDATTLKVRVYYNNVLIGAEQTVTDATIRENTKHALFSTYSGNSFDNRVIFARGSNNEYAALEQY